MPTRRELTDLVYHISIIYARTHNMRDDLCGMCAIAATGLAKLMTLNDKYHNTKYKPRIVYWSENGRCHFFVKSGRYIYDPTFSQFCLNKFTHVGLPTLYHKITRQARSLQSFLIVDSQRPSEHTLHYYINLAMKGNLLKLKQEQYSELKEKMAEYSSYI